MLGINALAYLSGASMMNMKSLTNLTTGMNVKFFCPLMLQTGKLDHLSLECLLFLYVDKARRQYIGLG